MVDLQNSLVPRSSLSLSQSHQKVIRVIASLECVLAARRLLCFRRFFGAREHRAKGPNICENVYAPLCAIALVKVSIYICHLLGAGRLFRAAVATAAHSHPRRSLPLSLALALHPFHTNTPPIVVPLPYWPTSLYVRVAMENTKFLQGTSKNGLATTERSIPKRSKLHGW